MKAAARSFKWGLIRGLVLFEAVAVSLGIVIAIGIFWTSGLISEGYENGNLDVLKDAVERDARGNLIVRDTPALAKLRREAGDIWYVVRDREGRQLTHGAVPAGFTFATEGLARMNDARFRTIPDKNARPDAVVKWVETPAGEVQIFTGTDGSLTIIRLITSASGQLLYGFVPLLLFHAMVTIVVTPVVVRRVLAGLRSAAERAEHIAFDTRGVAMPTDDVPREFLPLVQAMNDALERLDAGYARQARFLAQAAHELRTPIAILGARLASLPAGPEKARLEEDASRLSVLAGQLLDLQRLESGAESFVPVDLVHIAKRVTADLAPLAFSAGYEVCFEAEDAVTVLGDQLALARAVTNLIQNAIEHGGRRGTIDVRVNRPATITVSDEGAGVPPGERARIFEPFYRLDNQGGGAGLGLNLVRQIVELHGGRITVSDGEHRGVCFRVLLSAMQPPIR